MSRARITIVAAVVVIAAIGYWWLNRPPGPFKVDNSGLYPINVNGKYGFMDRSGKTVITPQFEETRGFSEGLANVRIGTKFGYINTKGEVVITPQFDAAMVFANGRAAVKLCCGTWGQQNVNNRFGFIDKDGKYISSPEFLLVSMRFGGGFALVRGADGRNGIMDRSGKVVAVANVDQGAYFGFTDGLAPAAAGGKWGYIDTTGKWVINPQFDSAYDFADGLAPVQAGGRWGYIDQNGKFVINPQFDEASSFNDGYASFRSGDKYGFIDTKGRVVVEPQFVGLRKPGWYEPAAGFFKEGLARVKTEDGWGFIDTTGKMVLSPQFDSAGDFQNGLARVTVAGKEAYVNKAGAFVVDPYPGRSGIPTRPVQELWTGTPPRSDPYRQRFIMIREGTQIRGYSYYYFGQRDHAIDLQGQTAADGSFSVTDKNGTTWKGKFVSSMLITGDQVNPPGASVKEFPIRLRLVRDATAWESNPLPPTNSDWSVFLSSFKDAVQRRDSAALSRMVTRGFMSGDRNDLTPGESLPIVFSLLDAALSRGVETSSSAPWGSPLRSILVEHPIPNYAKVTLIFSQDGDQQWRWAGSAYL